MQLPLVKTKLTTQEFLNALQAADPSLSREAAGIFYAQWSFETGGGNSCYCFNFGNIKAGNSGADYFALPGTWEIIGGKKVILDVSNPGSWFRAFTDAVSGAKFYLTFLQKRYGAAYTAALSGDPTAFVHALKQKGYFTGDEAVYTKNVVYLYNRFINSTSATPAHTEEPLPTMDSPIFISPKVDSDTDDVLHDLEATDAPLKLPAKIDFSFVFKVLKAIYELFMKFKKP